MWAIAKITMFVRRFKKRRELKKRREHEGQVCQFIMRDEDYQKGRVAVIKVWKTKVKKTQRKTTTEKI